MKYTILLALSFTFYLNSYSQKEYKYCELVGISKWFSSKILVAVDSGQGFSYDVIKDTTDVVSAVETKNEKVYVTTTEKTFEGKMVQSDAKGNFIWKKIEVGGTTEKKVKSKVFNSMVEGMNYMGKSGWEFVQAYVVSENNQNVYRWLLKKTK